MPRPRRSGWFTFGWAALATGLIVGLGALGLWAIENNAHLSSILPNGPAAAAASNPTPTLQPVTDAALSVTILNGTDVSGLAGRVGDAMVAAGWTVGARLNADADTIPQTTVYYAKAADEAAALGLANALGGVPHTLSQDFPGADLTVVLGAGYAGPGAR